MRHFILSILLTLLAVAPLRAGESVARAVISDQIAAFEAGELGRAYGFASPFIQEKFQTPETFGRMVREGYPMVWRPSEVTFLEAREMGGRLWQEVFLRDAAGRGWIAEYELVGIDGEMRINGVRIREAPDQAV
ncbi:DUF4864 domain-containing protein [Roseovarius ramblicola]|uniref:DUF4864 domain-containing protein n=1 Tax=Roseovarius ramblicola TaxID=2022336 RepID=A0ABV5HXR5_9RHOB